MQYAVLQEETPSYQPFQPMIVPIQNGESGNVSERDCEVSWFDAPPSPRIPIQFMDRTEMCRVIGIRIMQNRGIRRLEQHVDDGNLLEQSPCTINDVYEIRIGSCALNFPS